MLLVITLAKDDNMQDVMRWVKKPFIRFNWDENPLYPMSYEWDGSKLRYAINGVDAKEITSVWYRIAYLNYKEPPNEPYYLLNRKSREEMITPLFGLLETAFWVSNPFAMQRAENKVLQMEEAIGLGMCVPRTMVTSSPEEAASFREQVGEMVVKPLAHQIVRLDGKIHAFFTSRVRPGTPIDFSLLGSSPAIFQEEIQRVCDIRTIVVGDKAFSMEIHQVRSKKGDVDYRMGMDRDLEFKAHYLPTDLEQASIKLVKKLGLKYGAMDFLLGVDGNYYFLENNPAGAWKFVENYAGHSISQAMGKLLS